MTIAAVLLIMGLLLILVEFYLPGAVMGIIGAILIFSSTVVVYLEYSSLLGLFVYFLICCIAIALTVKFAVWIIPKSKSKESIYLSSDQAGFKASHYDKSVIGKTAVVVTDLKPGGHILVDGKRLQAISQNGYIVKGSLVLILGGEEESLKVKLIAPPSV